MSPTKKLISDLTDKSTNYTLKVKVVQKWRAAYSPKNTKYQRYIMQDEKGEEISATVFGDDVEMYDKNVQQNSEYEISNAKLRPVREEYKKKPNELEMQFTPYTVIRPLFVEDGGTSVINYVDLSSIALDFDNKDLYDVVGVILYLEPNRSIEKRNGSGQVDVRELVLLDHSVTHPVTITVWGDLARDECQQLSAAIESACVIGVTSLRVSTFKGFSLATSLSTHFITDPTGEKAIALSKWAAANTELLSLKRQTILEARLSKLHPKLLNVAQLNQKKGNEAIVDEKIWLRGHVEQLDVRGVRVYVGCNGCGQKTDVDKGQEFTCDNKYCKGKKRMACARMTLPFMFTDGTSTIKLSAFTDDAQKILDTTAEHLYAMSYQDRENFFSEAAQLMVKKVIFIQVVPAPGLVMSNMLRWLLKQVSFEAPQGI